jgi:hypothetical protein
VSERHEEEKERIAHNPPDGNGDTQKDGVRALGDGIAIKRSGYGAKAFVTDVRINPVMGIGKIHRIQKPQNPQNSDRPKIAGVWQRYDLFFHYQ